MIDKFEFFITTSLFLISLVCFTGGIYLAFIDKINYSLTIIMFGWIILNSAKLNVINQRL